MFRAHASRGDSGSIPPPPFRILGNFIVSLCLYLRRNWKAMLVSMPGEVKHPTQRNKTKPVIDSLCLEMDTLQ